MHSFVPVEGSELSDIDRAALANQNVAINIPRERTEEWPLYLPDHKLQPSNGAKDCLISNKNRFRK